MNEEEMLDSQLWSDFNHYTSEAFWDVAVWIGSNWAPGSLDPADRKRIVTGVAAWIRKSEKENTDVLS